MKFHRIVAAAALVASAALTAPLPALAQGAPQTIASVDVHALASGYRASRIIGAAVRNDRNQRIGKIDDLIVSRDHAFYAVVSVGGFLGMDKHLIAVPYSELHATGNNHGFVLPGASKSTLKALPEYKYAS